MKTKLYGYACVIAAACILTAVVMLPGIIAGIVGLILP